MKNAKAIVDWIAWAEPQYDFNPIIDEWCREAPKELDFNLEAGMPLLNLLEKTLPLLLLSEGQCYPQLFKSPNSLFHLPLFLFHFVENTRTVSRNLGCSDGDKGLGIVNVFIPEVIQAIFLPYNIKFLECLVTIESAYYHGHKDVALFLSNL